MKIIKSIFVLSSILVIGQAMPINAQSVNSCFTQAKTSSNPMEKLTDLGRALNLARQTGEATNGGIGKYRAEASMFGPMDEMNCTVSGDNTWTFSFQGHTPYSNVPTVETVVIVNNKTWDIVVDRNTSLNIAGNNLEIPMNTSIAQNNHYNNTDMQGMMTQMQDMMLQMQKTMVNMTPEQKKAHQEMMTGDMHTMMMQMDKMHNLMMRNQNGIKENIHN